MGVLRWILALQMLMSLTSLFMVFYADTTHRKEVMVPLRITLMCPNEQRKAILSVQTITKKVTIDQHKQPKTLPTCELEHISKPVLVNTTLPTWKDLNSLSAVVRAGGHYKPVDCRSKQSTTIIIPYRDGDTHLKLFLRHMHPLLQDQKLNYRIYVVELEKNVIFNRGLLMNAGFIESSRMAKTDCVVFHDVDMLPLDGSISYSCNYKFVKHPSHYVKQFNYKPPYKEYLGGVLIFNESVFREVNGFSNRWGWGGVNDDMRTRLQNSSIPIDNPASKKLRYWSSLHTRQVEFVNRFSLLNSTTRLMHNDGLNSAKKMYSVLKIEKRPLYTWIYVSANQTMTPVKGINPVYQPDNGTL